LFKKTASSAESKTSIKEKLSKATANATESASRQEKSVNSADEVIRIYQLSLTDF
jgi:hypothetical protein